MTSLTANLPFGVTFNEDDGTGFDNEYLRIGLVDYDDAAPGQDFVSVDLDELGEGRPSLRLQFDGAGALIGIIAEGSGSWGILPEPVRAALLASRK